MTKDLPIYKITIDPEYSDGEDLGIEQIAFTSNPAIKIKGMAFKQEYLVYSDDLKYRITAPAMIPMEIYRRDDETGEYYVQFTAETIEQIHAKFMQDLKNRDIFNLEHDQAKQVPAYILESWIVDEPQHDKSFSTFGIEVPKGTLMITAQVTDKDYYNELVKAEQVGFSIEGFLGLKLSNQINKYNMNKLPDGEHLIEGKIYVVKGGEIIEIKDAPKEEVAMEDSVVEEEVTTETEPIDEQPEPEELVKEEEMAVDVATDAEAVLAIVAPVLEEQVNNLLKIIADLKSQMEEMLAEKAEDEIEMKSEVKMSIAEKFSALNKLSNN